jgi:hypothetical protein
MTARLSCFSDGKLAKAKDWQKQKRKRKTLEVALQAFHEFGVAE